MILFNSVTSKIGRFLFQKALDQTNPLKTHKLVGCHKFNTISKHIQYNLKKIDLLIANAYCNITFQFIHVKRVVFCKWQMLVLLTPQPLVGDDGLNSKVIFFGKKKKLPLWRG